MLTSMRNLATGLVTELAVVMVFYIGGRHMQQPPWVVRPSGQYVFHPAHEAEPVRTCPLCRHAHARVKIQTYDSSTCSKFGS